jgi:NADPH-dependent glutamate synthase beta subunit-like oxidoreductase/bacterioferritin-associated ferredoxin
MILLIGQGKWNEALALLSETNPLPGITGRVCNSPCEQGCNRSQFDGAVSIRAIERALGDYAVRNGQKQPVLGSKHKEKVAVVGSGPAGLSCAYRLARQGFKCTVFEQNSKVGGILRYGIPSYRLPKDVLDCEIGRIQELGVDFETNRKWGSDLKMENLKAYDAIFLALGFQKCRILGIPGEDNVGVMTGTDFLAQVNSGSAPALSGTVLVIGGGNGAVDSARVALRLGAEPILIYRRRQEDMPGIRSETDALIAEGIELKTLLTPVRFIGRNGRLTAVECTKMTLGETGADGRRWPIPVPGSNFEIPASAAIVCLGETGNLDGAPPELMCEGERIDTDPWGRTSMPNIFAGGDIATGMGTVAHAIGSGKRVALAIAAYLRKESGPHAPVEKPVASAEIMNFDYWDPIARQATDRIRSDPVVLGFDEIHGTIRNEGAVLEAARCGHCGVRPEFDTDVCRGCSNCSSRCPTYAISLRTLERPYKVGVDVDNAIRPQVYDICYKARIHPESIVCFCTATRAMEIAAAIVKGAKNPEDVSRKTGARTGCGVLCIQPIFRLMRAAGLELGIPLQSDVWYPTTPTIWDIPSPVIRRYEDRGFKFAEDKEFLEQLTGRGPEGSEEEGKCS